MHFLLMFVSYASDLFRRKSRWIITLTVSVIIHRLTYIGLASVDRVQVRLLVFSFFVSLRALRSYSAHNLVLDKLL